MKQKKINWEEGVKLKLLENQKRKFVSLIEFVPRTFEMAHRNKLPFVRDYSRTQNAKINEQIWKFDQRNSQDTKLHELKYLKIVCLKHNYISGSIISQIFSKVYQQFS
jgi:hypothetical protein